MEVTIIAALIGGLSTILAALVSVIARRSFSLKVGERKVKFLG
jgi:hypothetical protein